MLAENVVCPHLPIYPSPFTRPHLPPIYPMCERMRNSQSSTRFNRAQQYRAICLKQSVLKMGDLPQRTETALGAGGRPVVVKDRRVYEQ